ncbi:MULTISPECIES: glycosyltransferase family 2 protein [unclassified Mesorhizobium]|uniref:glycosyltransferase family 2 protein n=1 Tax=unclassified Mesorhizobium TaxID=325217 RepID=UPI000F75E2AC|nr:MULTISPECIES: glycosyltransferase family 2 protein [unclassified Mesorhizobium]AZO63876.1 glycosyltransferase family 2 protein [Mesorhizobium sp. M6A.T.Cr.TU.016.01.1.1]RUU31328.1 glycosyltransferase [Mesorhizobium sp. M6A.T.Ce.TU.016.01.1.1]RWP54887.1 MAG: glycosyltransferase [Mesorhizobium sp.]RWQ85688.1 MAG: glycosyltransferase [Mesorhizobium sp.]
MLREEYLVSIIIPVKNGLPHIAEVYKMIKCQDADFEFEVIVIDSGSTDGSLDAVPLDDKRFRLIKIPSASFGHGRTRNFGVEVSHGELCVFLTHDAVPASSQWLRELVRPLREDPRIAAVFGRHIAHENASPFTAWELEMHFAGLRQWPVVWISDAREYTKNQGLRQAFHFYSDNSSCLRKSVWMRHPYPDVSFAEDQLWAKTIVEAGYRKAFSWDSIVYHSHDYSFWTRLMRSYDESKALYELFGYRLSPSKREMLRQIIRTTARDLKLAVVNRWFLSNFWATVGRPFDNIARQVGYYLGTADISFVKRNETKFSRDRQLMGR